MAVKLQSSTIKIVILLLLTVTGLIILFPLINIFRKGVKRVAETTEVKVTEAVMNYEVQRVKVKYGNHPDTKVIADNIVPLIHYAFHGHRNGEDEESAISMLNQLKTVTQVKIASELYKSFYGSSLANDSIKYLTDGADAITSGFGYTSLGKVKPIVTKNWY